MKHSSSLTTTFASIQWLFFIFANTIVVPISIGAAFDLSPDIVTSILRNSFIFTGIACMLQGSIGHRFPLMEGHSGLMWGLLLNLALSASSMGMSFSEIGGGIATGILLAGGVTLLIGLFNGISYIQRLFTPMVMSVYLFLLTFQLILIFFKGMFKYTNTGQLDVGVSLLSLFIVAFVTILKIRAPEIIGNFSILIGIMVGWVLYELFFPNTTEINIASYQFDVFPLGEPNLQWGIIFITFLAGFINLSNVFVSIQAGSRLFQTNPDKSQYKNAIVLTGSYSIVSAVLGLVPYAPFTSSIGFLESTQMYKRKPFLIGGGLLTLLGLIPILGAWLSTMPITIGNAVLFVAYIQLFGTALTSLKGFSFDSKSIYRIGLPVLIGVGIMNLQTDIFADLPIFIRPLLMNGFIFGVLLSIILELLMNSNKETNTTTR